MKFFVAVISVALIQASLAWAGEPFSDQLVQTPSIAKPKRGSLKGDFAELGEKALNLTSGSFTIGLPVGFPSERGGMQQPYSVSYSPGFGISEYGIGWNAGLMVSRMQEIGKIDFSTDDLMTPFGQMVEGSDGYYYSKDLRKKIKADLSGQEFTVYLPNGDVAIFGQASGTDFNDIHENAAVYSWYLRETSDQVGRKTVYTYDRFDDDGRLYLTEISYGGLGTDYEYRIDFTYEATHKPFVDHSLGRIQVSNHRVSEISLKSDESGVFTERYRYDLNYEDAVESPAFYLTSMQKVYSSSETEPFINFNYDNPRDFLTSTSWKDDSSLDGIASLYNGIATLYSQTSTVDFNLDGRPDLEIGPSYERFVRTDTGFESYTPPTASGEISKWCLFPVEQSRKPRKFLQFFGPSTDQMVYEKFEFNNETLLEVCEVNGERIETLTFPKGWHDNGTTIFHDVDGDLLPDLVHLNGKQIQYALNTSSGSTVSFDTPTAPAYINLPSYFYGFWIKDMNGDGHEDLVLKGDSAIYVHYGIAGGGFATDYVFFSFYLPSGAVNSRNIKDSSVIWVDANKDSLPDVLLQFDGLFSLHINSGALFTQIEVPSLFAGAQLFNNTMVADLGATGGTQLVSSVRDGGSYSIQTLDLDRPSLGLLTSVDDGKGNSTSFTFAKSNAQEGVQNRKTIVATMTSKATGEGDTVRTLDYGDIQVHSLTSAFLGFKDTESTLTGVGSNTATYVYDNNNIQKVTATASVDTERPDVVKYSENTYTDITLAGITAPFVSSTESGHRTASGATKAEQTASITTNSSTLCETQRSVTSSSLNMTTTTVYDSLANFTDHLDCLPKDQTISATGTNSYSHEIHFTRDAQGRVTKVEQGTTGSMTTVQDITYGTNGRLATIDNAATGTTSVTYDANYRITKITNPDGTENEITDFEFLNDQPKALKLKRDSEDFFSYFRFDGLGRLNKQWDNLENYSETTPQMSLSYVFAGNTKPGKIYQTMNVEKTASSFGNYQDIALETARGKALAGIIETSSNYKVSGLKDYDNQNLITKTFRDHLISSSTDFAALEVTDLDFTEDLVDTEEKELLGGLLSQTTAVETSLNREVDVDVSVNNNDIETTTTLNNNSSLETKTFTNEMGHVTKYRDESGVDFLYDRDSLGRIRKITFPDGIEQTVQYESRFGKISEIERDHIGKITYVYSNTTTLLTTKTIYDKNSLKIRTEDFTYDSIGRVTKKTLKTYDSGGLVTATLDYNYKYDGTNLDVADQPGQDGFLTGVESTEFTKKMVYRLDGKVEKQILIIPNEKEFVTEFEYFSQGDLKSKREKVLSHPGGTVLVNYQMTYEYDRFGNLTAAKKDGSAFASFTYNSYNEVDTATINGSKDLKYFYDATTRKLNDYREESSGTTLMKQVMSWNNRGLIDASDLTLGTRTITNAYTYSDRGFLSSQTQTDSGGTAQSHDYAYDEGSSSIYRGTLTSYQVNGGTAKAISITATSWTINGVTYGLDNSGRVTSKGSKNFVYGVNGRIRESKNGSTLLATHHYDEEDNPVLKEINGGGIEVYLGDNIYTGGSFYEPVKIGSRMVGYFKDGTFKETSQDHLNTYVRDEAGTYNNASPFGERSTRTAEASDIFDFTLKGYDSDIEAVRMGRRFYDPKAKRFLRPDGYFFEQPDEIVRSPIEGGLYGYALNDPISYLDPSGEAVFSVGVSASGGVTFFNDFLDFIGVGGGNDTNPSPEVNTQQHNNEVNYAGFAAGTYIGTRRTPGGSQSGVFGTRSVGKIGGASGGIGVTLGFDSRDVEDVKGTSNTVGIGLFLISLSLTLDENNDVVGGAISGGFGKELGVFSTQSETGVIEGESPETTRENAENYLRRP